MRGPRSAAPSRRPWLGGRATALVVASLWVPALLGGCTDDGEAERRAAPVEPTRPTLVADACALVSPAALDAVTGLQFDAATPSRDQCTYTSTQAQTAIAVNVFRTGGQLPGQVLDHGAAECDPGTTTPVEDPAVAGGYGCLVAGVVTVAVLTHDDRQLILTGDSQQAGAQTQLLLEQLSALLAAAAATDS